MELSFPQPPNAVTAMLAKKQSVPGNVVFESIQKLATTAIGAKLEKLAALGGAVRAHEQFTIPLNKLLGDDPLAGVQSIGWRALDASPEGTIAARLLSYDSKRDKAELLALNVGPFGRATAEALASAQDYDVLGKFEFRFLLLPPIYLAAIWLASEGKNLLIPLAPCPDVFEPGKVYDETTFFGKAQGLAEEAHKVDNSPR